MLFKASIWWIEGVSLIWALTLSRTVNAYQFRSKFSRRDDVIRRDAGLTVVAAPLAHGNSLYGDLPNYLNLKILAKNGQRWTKLTLRSSWLLSQQLRETSRRAPRQLGWDASLQQPLLHARPYHSLWREQKNQLENRGFTEMYFLFERERKLYPCRVSYPISDLKAQWSHQHLLQQLWCKSCPHIRLKAS